MVPLGPHPLKSCVEPTVPASISAFRRSQVSWWEVWVFSLPALAAPHLLAVTALYMRFQSSLLYFSVLFWLWALRLQSTGLLRLQFDLLLFRGRLLSVSSVPELLVFLFRFM